MLSNYPNLDDLLADIAVGAGKRDRERLLAEDALDALSSAGVFAATVPLDYAGPGSGAIEVFEIIRRLATVDPNVAQIPQSHFAYLRLVELAASAELKRDLYREVLTGARIANAQTERGSKTVADISTRIEFDGNTAVVTGEKFYCTGSLTAHWLAILARDLDGVDHVAFTPVSAAGITIEDDWTGMGQRTTASGTVRLDRVRVRAEYVVPRADAVTGPYGYGAFAQGIHAAIDAGIARGALSAAAEFVSTSSRPWFEAGVQKAEDDPLLIQRFGELEIQVRSAEATLRSAASAVDEIVDEPTASEASLQVAAAKVVADQAALSVTNALFELGGTRSADDRLGLHRHWRNARTHTLHDPVRWKIHHLGRWAVAGQPPPRGPQL